VLFNGCWVWEGVNDVRQTPDVMIGDGGYIIGSSGEQHGGFRRRWCEGSPWCI
jgi:hypothetical protein